MAAMASQTGYITFCGGMSNTVLLDFYAGYKQGALAYNPDIRVEETWMNSFSDPSTGKNVATASYSDGADVVFACIQTFKCIIFCNVFDRIQLRSDIVAVMAALGQSFRCADRLFIYADFFHQLEYYFGAFGVRVSRTAVHFVIDINVNVYIDQFFPLCGQNCRFGDT